MEDYERFKLNKSNVVMIIILIGLLVITTIMGISLFRSLKAPKQELPSLNITQGRYTTNTTLEKSVTTTTTTTEKILTDSPYYEVDYNSLLNDEIYKKNKLSREEALKVVEGMYELMNSLYDIKDFSIFKTNNVIKYAKEGETDVITVNNSKYGELYNFDTFINEFIDKPYKSLIHNYTYKDKKIIYKDGKTNKYYRLENIMEEDYPIFINAELKSVTEKNITANIRYYSANYKELGYSSPNYTNINMELSFDGRWKVRGYNYPTK